MSCGLAPDSVEIVGHETNEIQVSEEKELEVRWGVRNVLDLTAKAQQAVGSRHLRNRALTQSQ